MNIVPWLFWAGALLFGTFNAVFICSVIEKSGVRRLGATGKLFRTELPDENGGPKS